MVILQHITAQLNMQRQRIIRDHLPDRCTINTVRGAAPVINEEGIEIKGTPIPRPWLNPFDFLDPDTMLLPIDPLNPPVPVTSIPCKMSTSRAFRPERGKYQVLVADEFLLELPYNLKGELQQTDIVICNGRRYQIRKLTDQSEWDLTLEVLIEELSAVLDGD